MTTGFGRTRGVPRDLWNIFRTRGVPRESWYVDTVLVWWSGLALEESHEKPRQDATGTVVDTVL